jgi:UDP-N-acetylglucosamine 2-epimerase (non-hydrolysing)
MMAVDIKTLYKTELAPKLAVVVGTRPGIIKFSPVIRELRKAGIVFFIIHTGQHYSYNMDQAFFDDLQLPSPSYSNDRVRNLKYHGEQTAEMIRSVEQALLRERPRAIIVGGDANTNMAAALAGRKLGIQVAHMEAGLRSHDWSMPEEHNRIIIDHISEYLFAPSEPARQNLIADNVKGNIWVVGNTIVDAVKQNLNIAHKKSKIIERLGLARGEYILLTCHREENVDLVERITGIVNSVRPITETFGRTIVFPVHPRTRKRLIQFDLQKQLESNKRLFQIEPVGYLDFLNLLANAWVVLTDSGGIQEESCIMKVPCVTLRNNTERPETLEVGSNTIAGVQTDQIIKAIEEMVNRPRTWTNPFGDGNAARRIISILHEKVPL